MLVKILFLADVPVAFARFRELAWAASVQAGLLRPFVERAASSDVAESLMAIESYDAVVLGSGLTADSLDFVLRLMWRETPVPVLVLAAVEQVRLDPEVLALLSAGQVRMLDIEHLTAADLARTLAELPGQRSGREGACSRRRVAGCA